MLFFRKVVIVQSDELKMRSVQTVKTLDFVVQVPNIALL